MKTLKFKTNIKCGGCIASVSPFLDQHRGITSWTVDTNTAEKLLTVEGSIDAKEVINTLSEAGFQAEAL